jgi:hypothetical protein
LILPITWLGITLSIGGRMRGPRDIWPDIEPLITTIQDDEYRLTPPCYAALRDVFPESAVNSFLEDVGGIDAATFPASRHENEFQFDRL